MNILKQTIQYSSIKNIMNAYIFGKNSYSRVIQSKIDYCVKVKGENEMCISKDICIQ